MKIFKGLFMLFSVVIFLLAAVSFVSSARDARAEVTVQPREQTETERTYIIRCEGDMVCLYESGSDRPLGRLNIDPRDLPEEDRRLLECGILAQGEEQLISVLEDYSS